MGDPDEPSLRSVQSKARAAFGFGRKKDPKTPGDNGRHDAEPSSIANEKHNFNGSNSANLNAENAAADGSSLNTTPNGASTTAVNPTEKRSPMSPARITAGTIRFLNHTKNALTHSWINILLVIVPVGIAAKLAHLKPEVVFATNAIAIIPLAGLLAHATEVVAARVGDALGALLNVSFGNAVELILFIILLSSNQIAVVQASLLGSILANLLLILGMAFLLGGLRFQEQVYNSTVTQMSGVMLALAVMSLLLPTAFHAAFNDNAIADHETLVVSRITSIILLLVYGLYLLFQLKSHRYLYASTPQHIIDEESHPGVLADVFDTSSSDSSSSSSSSDSDNSSNSSNGTVKRKAKRMVKRLRRKSSASSKDTATLSKERTGSISHPVENEHMANGHVDFVAPNGTASHSFRDTHNDVLSGDEADMDNYGHTTKTRDFETGSSTSLPNTKRDRVKHKHKSKKKTKDASAPEPETEKPVNTAEAEPKPKVVFSDQVQQTELTPVASRKQYRPALPSLLSNNVFSNPQNPAPSGPVPNIRMAAPRAPLRRAKSMPDRMNDEPTTTSTNRNQPAVSPQAAMSLVPDDEDDDPPEMSIKAAIFMLLISTGLVAVCADFMSDAIEPMVESSGISQAFIGLIIIPIVGNAAEHVTAVVVATKNKMDLAIGVAVGSSIQIALFITPIIVILGWIMNKEMTLYFNIFETVALFVTVLVVNFLVLDGRSNYLEGSLLIAAYTIIAVVSYYYPDGCEASAIGGNDANCATGNTVSHAVTKLVSRMVGA